MTMMEEGEGEDALWSNRLGFLRAKSKEGGKLTVMAMIVTTPSGELQLTIGDVVSVS
jgi:hypothetical protein